MILLLLTLAALAAVFARREVPATAVGTRPGDLGATRARGNDLAVFAAG